MLGEHAIVVGASMSGLLAARAIAKSFDRVTILDKDDLGAPVGPRRSVPQGAHAHGLLSRGRDIFESLFPGISSELVARGAMDLDYLNDMIWVSDGQAICPGPSSIRGLLVSRPVLEDQVRTRVQRTGNIEFLDRATLANLIVTQGKDRVIGLVYERDGVSQSMFADLVVDATGRGSRTPQWLVDLGYQKPREEKVGVGVTYTTCTFRRDPRALGGKLGAVAAASQPNWRCGAMLAQEGDRWIASIGGYFGDRAPSERDGFLEFCKSLPVPHFYDVLKTSEALTPFVTYGFVASLRRRYDELPDFPRGYVVVGDALCSFNPIYGQGMTVAALEAEALGRIVRETPLRFAIPFFKKAKSLIDVPWDIVVGNDLLHPKTVGHRGARVQTVNWYLRKLKQRLPTDAVISEMFLSVSNMKEPSTRLFSPKMLWRVFGPLHGARPQKERAEKPCEERTKEYF